LRLLGRLLSSDPAALQRHAVANLQGSGKHTAYSTTTSTDELLGIHTANSVSGEHAARLLPGCPAATRGRQPAEKKTHSIKQNNISEWARCRAADRLPCSDMRSPRPPPARCSTKHTAYSKPLSVMSMLEGCCPAALQKHAVTNVRKSNTWHCMSTRRHDHVSGHLGEVSCCVYERAASGSPVASQMRSISLHSGRAPAAALHAAQRRVTSTRAVCKYPCNVTQLYELQPTLLIL
jgi:hypothetical protein